MTARLLARIAESDRLRDGQEAEGMGLRAARVFTTPLQFSKDPARQARFELGFREGRALMEVGDGETDRAGALLHTDGRLPVCRADHPDVWPEASGESTPAP